MFRFAPSSSSARAWVVTLRGELESVEPTLRGHAPGRSPARDFTSAHDAQLRLTQRLAPARVATPACLRSVLARIEARIAASADSITVSLDETSFASPLAAADGAVMTCLERGDSIGAAFTLSLHPRDLSTRPASFTHAVQSAEHVLTALGLSAETPLRIVEDAIVAGPFDRGTSVHLTTAILCGIVHDAARKVPGAPPLSALAALERAREDLGDAFVDAWRDATAA